MKLLSLIFVISITINSSLGYFCPAKEAIGNTCVCERVIIINKLLLFINIYLFNILRCPIL